MNVKKPQLMLFKVKGYLELKIQLKFRKIFSSVCPAFSWEWALQTIDLHGTLCPHYRRWIHVKIGRQQGLRILMVSVQNLEGEILVHINIYLQLKLSQSIQPEKQTPCFLFVDLSKSSSSQLDWFIQFWIFSYFLLIFLEYYPSFYLWVPEFSFGNLPRST